ncbi:MAG: hypothetical protein KDI39_22205, partial [Pseudomonadales bacterium]|nr:hypothetical protein [Pseudomonadales bacterium]
MALIANNTLIGKEKTGLTFAAGQSLNFKLNDDSYGDNEGALTVSYDCVESSMTGAFTVPANSETGVAFTSPSSTKPLQCSFTASGLVSEALELAPYIDANGNTKYGGSVLANANFMALILQRESSSYELVGKSGVIDLQAGETIRLLTNDSKGNNY